MSIKGLNNSALLIKVNFLLFAIGIFTTTESSKVCRTLKNERGFCVPIAACEPILEMLQLAITNQTERENLRKSQCGWDSTQNRTMHQVLVCCSKTTTEASELPKPGICGNVLNDRILGGSATKLDEFPWMALLSYKKPYDNYGFHCGGSLINSRYVLTAGHCVNNPAMPKSWSLDSVRLGEWNTSSNPDCVPDGNREDCAPMHIDVPIETAIAHELYSANSIDQFHDIALLRLKEQVKFNDFVKPICLPIGSVQDSDSIKLEGTAMDVAGWGVTETNFASDIKLKIVVNGWDLASCQKQYKSYEVQINSTQVCAGGDAGIDTCRGDSGGPLMIIQRVNEMDIYFVAGIVSYGPKPCGLKGWPGIYTRVGSFIDWIQRNLEA